MKIREGRTTNYNKTETVSSQRTRCLFVGRLRTISFPRRSSGRFSQSIEGTWPVLSPVPSEESFSFCCIGSWSVTWHWYFGWPSSQRSSDLLLFLSPFVLVGRRLDLGKILVENFLPFSFTWLLVHCLLWLFDWFHPRMRFFFSCWCDDLCLVLILDSFKNVLKCSDRKV